MEFKTVRKFVERYLSRSLPMDCDVINMGDNEYITIYY